MFIGFGNQGGRGQRTEVPALTSWSLQAARNGGVPDAQVAKAAVEQLKAARAMAVEPPGPQRM